LGFTVKNGHEDIIICKWESNGVDHYDTRSTATSNCKNIGFPNIGQQDILLVIKPLRLMIER
jgi:hypothetical protein